MRIQHQSDPPPNPSDRPAPEKYESQLRIALAGNPNSGKTSLFNRLTGATQKVGNWSGVTVEIKSGTTHHDNRKLTVYDLPGTYSLSICSMEEQVARDFIFDEKPDIVIDVIDATNLERHLYLTLQLLELGVQPLLAFNMWDEVAQKGLAIDTDLLSRQLGCTIIPTNARTGEGIAELITAAAESVNSSGPAKRFVTTFPPEIESAIAKLETALLQLNGIVYPAHWLALQLLEADCRCEHHVKSLPGGKELLALRDSLSKELAHTLGDEPQTLITEARYGCIAGAVKEAVKHTVSDRVDLSEHIDEVVTHRFWAYPIFFLFMWLLFQVTFKLGEHPMHWIDSLFTWLHKVTVTTLPDSILRDLLADGIIAGVGGVIVFLPNILILFLGISVMEDTGYMARAAFITDKLMHRIGLHGKSFIPMLMGLGCSVPAIMAARTLESPKDRIKTILLTPLISCSARLPVFVLFASAFFPKHAGNMVFLFQVILSFGAFVMMALLFKLVLFRNAEDYPFVMELPPYRLPTWRSMVVHMWQKARHYLEKMGGVVLIFSIILWWASSFPKQPATNADFNAQIAAVAADNSLSTDKRSEKISDLELQRHTGIMENTYIGKVGKFFEPLVKPFGTDWRGAVALATGFVAKESVVSSMGVLYMDDNNENEENTHLREKLREHFTPLSAFAFMLFVLLYTPCLVALITVIREIRELRWSLFSISYQLVFAWIMATGVYQVGRFFGLR
ncbi:MAG: ferrous iron transport protein B [Chitinispirillaceae bacterium]|nr:ferrous iron transport protein B [Chitinispirillaceae bacterium]